MIDRRFTQTQHRFASDDLETMSEAHRYQAHIFDMFRAYIGKRVLEVGAGIGTMSRSLLDVAEHVVGIEPNQACATRALAALGDHPHFELRVCHLEEFDGPQLAADPIVRVTGGAVGAAARTRRSAAHRSVDRCCRPAARWPSLKLTISMYPRRSTEERPWFSTGVFPCRLS